MKVTRLCVSGSCAGETPGTASSTRATPQAAARGMRVRVGGPGAGRAEDARGAAVDDRAARPRTRVEDVTRALDVQRLVHGVRDAGHEQLPGEMEDARRVGDRTLDRVAVEDVRGDEVGIAGAQRRDPRVAAC